MAFFSKTDVVRLPAPDPWGNYWLRPGSTRVYGPCILHANLGPDPRCPWWFVSRGGDEGILFAGPRPRYFASPTEALAALQETTP